MRSKLLVLVVALAFVGLLFHSSCKTEEECTFNILGTWNISITIPSWSFSWSESLTFSGSATSGTVTGWQYEAGHTGTYTVSNCNTVMFVFEYYGWWGYTYVPFNGTGTNNTMNGTMSYYDDDYGSTYNGTWSGVKM
jgi:hypothetical protein